MTREDAELLVRAHLELLEAQASGVTVLGVPCDGNHQLDGWKKYLLEKAHRIVAGDQAADVAAVLTAVTGVLGVAA